MIEAQRKRHTWSAMKMTNILIFWIARPTGRVAQIFDYKIDTSWPFDQGKSPLFVQSISLQ
jgi:hypothetical protein